jgi:C-terminal processing protease CtpA/Prc
LAWNTDRGLLLGGPKDSRCALKLRRLDGSVQEVELTRTREAAELWAVRPRPHPSLPPFTVLPSGLGYFDLVQLERAQVDEAFEAVRETPGLILDLRGYPRGTAWAICGRLTNETFVMARFRRPRWAAGGPDEYTFEQPIDASGPWRYEAPIAVLVDNNAISQSEHSCLGFEGAARGRVTFVGAPTMGANGDVTNVVLPGNVYVSFSGHDVRHADGRQLQRVGIQPDVRVEPTIEGWLAGRDEVLDAAVELLTREK